MSEGHRRHCEIMREFQVPMMQRRVGSIPCTCDGQSDEEDDKEQSYIEFKFNMSRYLDEMCPYCGKTESFFSDDPLDRFRKCTNCGAQYT